MSSRRGVQLIEPRATYLTSVLGRYVFLNAYNSSSKLDIYVQSTISAEEVVGIGSSVA